VRTGVGSLVLAAAALAAAALAPAAVLAAGPSAASAATARTWTVSPGGAVTATAGKTTLKDTPTGAMIPCASSRMSGTLNAGGGLPGAGIGSFTTAAYSRCAAGGLQEAKLTARGLPWQLNLSSYDQQTGVARGTISHLKINVGSILNQCTAVINATSGTAPAGVVPVSYASKTGTLKILQSGGVLHWYHVSHDCAGIVRNGDAATLSASYTVSPRQVITSP
jgi:hypothetical protein